MKECCETDVPKKKYWHWVALGAVVLLAAGLQLIPSQGPPSIALKAKEDITAIVAALDQYATNNRGAYPDSLQPLVTPDTNNHCYLEGHDRQIPRDPWKREYHYAPPTPEHPKCHVWSLGSDGKRGGTGTAEDIDSEQIVDSAR